MRNWKHKTNGISGAAFTLVEMLAASAIFVVLSGALYSIFSSALRLRERAYATIEKQLPASAALSLMRRDLAGMVIPGGTLAGATLGQTDRRSGTSQDTLEFYTASGPLDEWSPYPWGDIQKVSYGLVGFRTGNRGEEMELVREGTRNLLDPNAAGEVTQERLISDVQGLEFQYLDEQMNWVDGWDSTLTDNKPPRAVKVSIDLSPAEEGEEQSPPIELICSIAVGDTETTTSTTSETNES
jgi:type II secretion system protein J